MKVTVLALIAYDSDTVLQDDFNITIQSLNNCQPPPTAIGMISCAALPTSLRKKNRLTIYKVPGLTKVKPLDVLRLPSLMHKGEETVFCLIVSPNNNYPPHIIEEYLNFYPKIMANIKSTAASKMICGLTGIRKVVDKKRQMDSEIAALAAGQPTEPTTSFMTTSYPIENAPVDELKFSGSVFYRMEDLDPDQVLPVGMTAMSSEQCLADYCKKSNICMFQVCTLTLNRLIFERMKMFRSVVSQ